MLLTDSHNNVGDDTSAEGDYVGSDGDMGGDVSDDDGAGVDGNDRDDVNVSDDGVMMRMLVVRVMMLVTMLLLVTVIWETMLMILVVMMTSSLFLPQLSSVAQSCLTLFDPMDCSTPGLPVHHQLPEFIQTHVHRVGDAIQPSHPLVSPSPPDPNPSQHQSLFQ